jgi:cellulose synthase/poly-beta-1,6-N-acetylglucosamine synthase-like glycosyltransferase
MIEVSIFAAIVMALGLGYFFTAMYLLSHPQPTHSTPFRLPKVAVIIAMRNEEEHILECLQSLKEQTYPEHLYDVYVANDRSTDASGQIAETYIENLTRFHLIKITEDKFNLKGKMNVLAQVLEQIESDLILITDADCIVPPKWIGTFVDYFEEDTGIAAGLTTLVPPPALENIKIKSGLFKNIQALDWIYLQTLAAACSNAKMPVSMLGNNFGFSMQAYRDTGTFKKIGFSVTEDYALMRAIEKTGKWSIKYTQNSDNTIFSHPLKNLMQFYHQRKRWVIGGKGMRSWGYFMAGLSALSHLAMLLCFILMYWEITAAVGIGLIIGTDYLIINRQLKKLSLNRLMKYFVPFEIFYTIYLIFFGAAFPLMKKVKWKERELI